MKVDLEKLRALPPHARTQISFFTATAVAGVIALVWVTTLGGRFAHTDAILSASPNEDQKEAVADEEESSIDWGTFTGKIKDQIGNITAAWGSIRIETGSGEAEELELSTDVSEDREPEADVAATTASSTPQNTATSTVQVGTSTVNRTQ